MDAAWQQQLESTLPLQDAGALLRLARGRIGWTLRRLTARLYSACESEKGQAVWGLGVLVADRQLVGQEEAAEQLRRFFWALSDESGMVPYGVPEAIGEILARRPELQEHFLPMLCSLMTDEDRVQSGAIERGVIWALGRVGPPVARAAPEAVEALRTLSETHPDRETREAAGRSLASVLKEGLTSFQSSELKKRQERRERHGEESE